MLIVVFTRNLFEIIMDFWCKQNIPNYYNELKFIMYRIRQDYFLLSKYQGFLEWYGYTVVYKHITFMWKLH